MTFLETCKLVILYKNTVCIEKIKTINNNNNLTL